MPRFSHTLREQRRLWRLLGELAARYLGRNACHLASPRYYGLMNPKPALAGVLGDALASVLNPQLAVEAHAPGATALEREALGWFLGALGWRRGQGQFTSGGSEANLVALKVALNHRLPGGARRGLRGLRGQPVFYVSEESHHSLEKFADLLGLGRDAVHWIPTDGELEIRRAHPRTPVTVPPPLPSSSWKK